MPIPVVCTSCGAKINAPDAAAGKRAKCPKCATVLTIPVPAPPEPEVEEDLGLEEQTAPPPRRRPRDEDEEADRPRPKKRKVVDEDEDERPRRNRRDEDEEDDEDERPRRKSKKAAKKKGVNPLILVVIGIVALLFLGGVGTAVWYFALREDVTKPLVTSPNSPVRGGSDSRAPAVPADDWEPFEVPQFRAVFKKGVMPTAKNKPGVPENTEINWTAQYDTEVIVLTISLLEMDAAAVELYQANAKSYYEQILDRISKTVLGGGMTLKERREFHYEGSKALDAVLTMPAPYKGTMVYRMLVAKGKLFQLVFLAERGPGLDDPMVRTFFDGFQAK